MSNLWLDLGNTRLKYWLTDDIGRVITTDAKQHLQAPNELLMGWMDRFARYAPDFIGISSVMGTTINKQICESLNRLGIKFEFVHVVNQHSAITSAYDPQQLGVDRWLQMLGAVDKSKRQCIVGCGTAMTIDLINQGHHLGGYIFPSIYLQREALFSGTRQITIVDGQFASIDVGTTTQQAVHHGVMLSIVGAINTVIQQYDNYELIITGGDAKTIQQHLTKPAHIREDLMLTGLMRFFETG